MKCKYLTALFLASISVFIALPANAATPSEYFDSSYFGGNLGYAWGSSNYSTLSNCRDSSFSVFCTSGSESEINGNVVAASGTGTVSDSFFSGGAQLGHNWRRNRVVFGGEVDFESFNFAKSAQESGVFPSTFLGDQYALSQSLTANWLTTFRARLGFLSLPRLLLYVTGGGAVTSLKMTSTYNDNAIGFGFPGGSGSNTQSFSQMGWAAGAGGEWYLAKHFSLKLEYLYVDFGSKQMPIALSNTADYTQTMQFKANLNANIVRLGLNYQF